MAENSAISWTDHTFNPWWGCTKVGPGCDFCYAETFDRRVGGAHWGAGVPRRLIKDWSKPLQWNAAAVRTGVSPWVFCASMADVFDNEVPAKWRERLWQLVRETPHLRWIFVTKRIGNAATMLPTDWPQAFGHCGLCITVVNQAEADRDVPKLLATPAPWRGVSAEPLLGPINFRQIDLGDHRLLDALDGVETWADGTYSDEGPWRLDWIIVGGESGPHARPMHPASARSIRDQCAAAGVSFHFKQWGEWLFENQVRDGQHPSARFFGTDGSPIDDKPPFGPANGRLWHWWENGGFASIRVGKAVAGRLLDGVAHDGMPPVLA